MATRSRHLGTLMRTLGRQLKLKLAAGLGLSSNIYPPPPSPRASAVEKVSRNALFELVGRAKSHPQRGERNSANPAYVALAELTAESGRPGLALGLRYESGEITFLDLSPNADIIDSGGAAFVGRAENLALWRRLEELIFYQVDRTMVEPGKPIRAPEEVDV